jgi:hypothetical protein
MPLDDRECERAATASVLSRRPPPPTADEGVPRMIDDLTPKKFWKITVSSLFPNDSRAEMVFEGFYPSEEAARDAALNKEGIDHGGSTIPTVVKVEEAGL